MRRRKSPVQQWVDSLPSPEKFGNSSLGSAVDQQNTAADSVSIITKPSISNSESVVDYTVSVDSESISIPVCTVEQVFSNKENINSLNMTVSSPIVVPNSPSITSSGVSRLVRDPSFQSDSSHCSSVESLLELRRADPEAILLSLGFGGGASSPQDQGPLSRIPKRFLQPSRLRGIVINDFVKQQQETSESLDSASLGYRGLTGSPHVVPSEIVQKIMQRLREQESHELDAYLGYHNSTNNQINNTPTEQDHSRLSVLSPDNRQYLDRPRSKSPDMRNKRMIIGQRSFAFGHDGDLIEVKPSMRRQSSSQDSDDVFLYSDENKESLSRPGPSNLQTDCSHSTPKKSSSIEIGTKQKADSNNFGSQAIPVNLNLKFKNISGSSLGEAVDDNQLQDNECLRRTNECFSKSSSVDQKGVCTKFSDVSLDEIKETFDSSCRRKSILKRQSNVDSDIVDNLSKLCSNTITLTDQCGNEDNQEEESEITCCHKRKQMACRVEKALQKNKKIEDSAPQNIKNMLSSVLSVRMEPGF